MALADPFQAPSCCSRLGKTYRDFEEQKTDLPKRTLFDDHQYGQGLT
jgi:hypothetical protein